jgi:lipopolysaccharide transport system permease protein
MEASASSPQVLEPGSRAGFASLRGLSRYRDLVYYLARREVASRYRQTAVGVFWALLQPLLLATVFSVFLGLLAKVDSQPDVPYPVFAVSGLVLWLFVSGAVATASVSTVANEALISKVYFPRVIIPFTYLFPSVIDFLLAFLVVIGTMLVYGVGFHVQILLMPLVVVVAFGLALGASLWLSALNVKYRDVNQVVPFLTLLGLFISPITYPLNLVPANLQPIYALNPITGLLEAYRWMLFGATDASPLMIAVPVVLAIVLVLTGVAYFQRAASTFADII